MDVIRADEIEWGGQLTAHRAGHMTHKVLFTGEEGSPDNYLFVLANERSDYFSPRHRHAWDQVRFCLEGSVPIARDLKVDAGEVGYFPEGVHYGPQEGGPDRIVLLLQFGGASGLGYLSPAQLDRARERLMQEGIFEGGVFKRKSGEGRKNEDAYEAIWRIATGAPIRYPIPRYRCPILMRPEGFAWREMAGVEGVRQKLLGSFAERGLSLELVALDSGARYEEEPCAQRRLIFVLRGAGSCDTERYAQHTAARVEPGERTWFAADSDTELFMIGIAPLSER